MPEKEEVVFWGLFIGGCITLRGFGICLFVSICCLMPCLLLWYLGYEPRKDWNNDAIKTDCTVLSYEIQTEICSYSCNCYTTCYGSYSSRTCTTNCQTCYRDCYDKYIWVSFEIRDQDKLQWLLNLTEFNNVTVGNITFEDYGELVIARIKIFDDKDGPGTGKLEKRFPIGEDVKCYYNKNNPTDVELNLKEHSVHFGFFIVFACLGFLICACWFFGEIIVHSVWGIIVLVGQ